MHCNRKASTEVGVAYLDGVRVGEGVQTESTGVLSAEEVGPYLKLRVGVVYTQVLDPGGKTLIEPEVGPPLHGHLTVT